MWLAKTLWYPGQLIRPYWRLGLDGAVEEIPREGPLIIASNHSSFLDPFFIGIAFPRMIRYLITDDWYYRSKLWEGFFASLGTEPVVGGKPQETIKAICRILDRGGVAGIFPEGGISYDGNLRRFKPGLSRIAALSGAPVLPIAVRGAFDALPRTRLIPRPSRVRIQIASPVVFPGAPHAELPSSSEREAFKEQIFTTIQALL